MALSYIESKRSDLMNGLDHDLPLEVPPSPSPPAREREVALLLSPPTSCCLLLPPGTPTVWKWGKCGVRGLEEVAEKRAASVGARYGGRDCFRSNSPAPYWKTLLVSFRPSLRIHPQLANLSLCFAPLLSLFSLLSLPPGCHGKSRGCCQVL